MVLNPGNISQIDGYEELTGTLAKTNLRTSGHREQSFKHTCVPRVSG